MVVFVKSQMLHVWNSSDIYLHLAYIDRFDSKMLRQMYSIRGPCGNCAKKKGMDFGSESPVFD